MSNHTHWAWNVYYLDDCNAWQLNPNNASLDREAAELRLDEYESDGIKARIARA